MTTPEGPHDGPLDPDEVRLSDLLSDLLTDAVSDVAPSDRLDSIRSRTKVTPMSARRTRSHPWRYALLGAAATAAVIGGIAVAGDQLGLTSSDDNGAPATSGHPRRSDHPSAGGVSPSSTPSSSSGTATAAPQTVAAYYLGDTPQGVRLYREFDQVPGADKLSAAVAALTATPRDPDYSTPWPDGAFTEASYDGDVVKIALADSSLHDRPADMSEQEAREAVQQVVYTLQAAVQARAGVQFTLDGNPVDQVLGVPTSEPIANDKQVDVLSLVSITSPEEGASASGTLAISGVANSFEANVPWQVLDASGTVVKKGYVTAEQAYGDDLYPWQGQVDVSGLSAGTYTFRAQTDDPSGGEGKGSFEDTRTFTVG
ncbi:MAG: Gmad2 immunoglobulin-like domain-containing protein [Nocardioides sp.]